MNDLLIAAVPFSVFVVFFIVWLAQLRKDTLARAARQQRVASPSATPVEAERPAVQQLA